MPETCQVLKTLNKMPNSLDCFIMFAYIDTCEPHHGPRSFLGTATIGLIYRLAQGRIQNES